MGINNIIIKSHYYTHHRFCLFCSQPPAQQRGGLGKEWNPSRRGEEDLWGCMCSVKWAKDPPPPDYFPMCENPDYMATVFWSTPLFLGGRSQGKVSSFNNIICFFLIVITRRIRHSSFVSNWSVRNCSPALTWPSFCHVWGGERSEESRQSASWPVLQSLG